MEIKGRSLIDRLVREGIRGLVPYPPGKPIEELERELGITGSIKLASNENPLGPSPLAIQAIREKLHTLHRYPDGSGYYLKSALSEKFGIAEDSLILGNGSNELLELVARTFLLPGEHAVQPFPTFLVYEKIVRASGGRITSVPLSDFRVDLDAVLEAVKPETKLVIINNPNNPTGTALRQNEILGFLKDLPEHLLVVLDEAYIEFTSDREVADGLALIEGHPNLFILRTFSKLYGLAGLRIGYGFGHPQTIDYMNRVRQPFNAGTLGQVAAEAALRDTEFVALTLKTVREGLAYLYHSLDEMGLSYLPSYTNFFLIKVPNGAKETYERLLQEGVIVRSMDSYGLSDYIRVNAGLPQENERFVNALRKVLTSQSQV